VPRIQGNVNDALSASLASRDVGLPHDRATALNAFEPFRGVLKG